MAYASVINPALGTRERIDGPFLDGSPLRFLFHQDAFIPNGHSLNFQYVVTFDQICQVSGEFERDRYVNRVFIYPTRFPLIR